MSADQQELVSNRSDQQVVRISNPYPIEIIGGKYRWQVRYPGMDGMLGTPDDVNDVRDVHVPVGVAIDLRLKSTDYVYLVSFPHFHLKEIAVPTLDFHLEFQPTTIGEFTLDGDELCGDPHPELKGRLFVDTVSQFESWLRQQAATQLAEAAR